MARGLKLENTSAAPPHDGGRRYRRFVPVAILVVILVLLYAAGWQDYLSLSHLADRQETMQRFVAAHPVSASLAFSILYALAVAVSFPAASILTIFGGFLFGWLAGGIMVAVAATVGATILFLAARSALGGFLCQRIGTRAACLAEGLEKDAFSYLLVLRLMPIFPFFIVNVAPAFFRIPLATYVAATFIGILPATFAYAYLGTGLGSALDAAAASGRQVSPADLVTPQLTLAFFLLALVAILPLVIRKLRAAKRG